MATEQEFRRHRRPAVTRLLTLALLLTSAGIANCSARSSPAPVPANCKALRPTAAGGWEKLAAGEIWSGVHTAIGTASVGSDVVIAAYFDPQRYLTVERIDLGSMLACTKTLPSRFGGWDAHNGISLAVSPDGMLHIVGNMHASRMFYASGSVSDLQSIQPRPMTGSDEESGTYPQFIRGPENALYFLYRSGHAGNGQWIVNAWREDRWERIGAIFADRDSRGPVSAYPTRFALGSDGRFHVAIVWRRNYDINSNFAVTYASTNDFKQWSGIGGASSAGPLGPESLPPVERTGEDAGLLNNPLLVLDDSSQPVVIYSRYSERGANAVFAAQAVNGHWQIRPLAVARTKLIVAGTGTLSGLPVMSLTEDCSNELAQVHVNFPPRDLRLITIDRRNSKLGTGNTLCPTWHSGFPFPKAPSAGMANVSLNTADVRKDGVGAPQPYLFYWFAQGANRDRPRQCTNAAPRACAPPPSELVLVRRAR
jgi:hypothetical protein